MEGVMEPISLSVKEQLDLFSFALDAMHSSSSLWEKGANFCLQYDVENGKKAYLHGGSELAGYLHKTIDSNVARNLGLELEPLMNIMDAAIDKKVFNQAVKTHMLVKILESDAMLYKEDLNRVLSDAEIRSVVQDNFDKAAPRVREHDEGLKRAYTRLKNYEREQIVRGGRTADDVTLKKNIKAVLGKEMTEAVYRGVAPHKEAIPELVAKAKEKGLSAEQIKKAVHEARRIAKEKAESDKLQDKQNTLEKAGFVRKIINRRRQQGK